MCQLAHFIVSEMRCQRLGLAVLAKVTQAVGQITDGLEHLARKPNAKRQRKQSEQKHGANHTDQQLLLAEVIPADIVFDERDQAVFAADGELVVLLSAVIGLVDIMHADGQFLPGKRCLVDRAIAPAPARHQLGIERLTRRFMHLLNVAVRILLQ